MSSMARWYFLDDKAWQISSTLLRMEFWQYLSVCQVISVELFFLPYVFSCNYQNSIFVRLMFQGKYDAIVCKSIKLTPKNFCIRSSSKYSFNLNVSLKLTKVFSLSVSLLQLISAETRGHRFSKVLSINVFLRYLTRKLEPISTNNSCSFYIFFKLMPAELSKCVLFSVHRQ